MPPASAAPDDAFGTALLDWALGGRVVERIERDDGHVEEGAGAEVYLADVDGWPAGERASLPHIRGRVVDAGCGAGRVAVVLQDLGIDVVGVDASPLAVRAAQSVGVRSVRRLTLEGLTEELDCFDSVLLFGNNFGIFGAPDRARQMLIRWARRAAPGTLVFAESTNAYCGGAPIIDRAYYRRNKARGLPPGRTRFRVRYRDLVGPWVTWLFASQQEVRAIVRGTGWQVVGVFGDGPTEPFVALLRRT